MIRILIVDDHPVVRSGIRSLLAGEPDLAVVGEAADGQQALTMARELRPAVVLMDLSMPGGDGATATAAILAERPDTGVVVLTSYDDDHDLERALDAGALGYLLKDCGRTMLLQALRSAARGESVLAPAIAARLVDAHRSPSAPITLSAREIEVVAAAARGRSNKQIAADLGIGPATVKSHLMHAFAKLEVNDRTSAVMRAIQLGLLPNP